MSVVERNALFVDKPPRWALGSAVSLADANDGWLTSFEAQPAFAEFKAIADADRDGRVTTYDYGRAKEFIAARW